MRRSLILAIPVILVIFLVLSLDVSAYSEETGDVEGTVYDHDGDPLADIEVYLILNSTVIKRNTTDANGRYSITDIEPGEYSLYVAVDDEIAIEQITIAANSSLQVDIHLIYQPPTPDDDVDDDDNDTNEAMSSSLLCYAVLFIVLLLTGIVIFIIILSRGYSKITSKQLMDHETRQRILGHIQANPGGHLRGIKEDLGLPMGVLTHHIYKMEAEEVIKSRMDGKFRRFYPYNHKIVKAPLLTGTQKKIYDIILAGPGIAPPDIADRLGKSRKTVYYHVQELEAKGVLRVDRAEKQFRCYVLQDT